MRINLFQPTLIVWVLVIYLAAIHDISWLFYVALGIVFAERIFSQFSLWLSQKIAMQIAQRTMAEIRQRVEQESQSGGMMGGRPE